jgi:HTH-type transcriptional regulator / antitoxin HigA
MIKLIRSKKEYEAALNRIHELMQSEHKANSDEYNELKKLSILVERYESKHFPIKRPIR